MAVNIRLDTKKVYLNEVFEVTSERLQEMSETLARVEDTLKTEIDVVNYMKTIAQNDNEFAYLLLMHNVNVEA